MNNAAMNTSCAWFWGNYVFHSLGYIPRSRIAWLCGNAMFNFWGTAKLFGSIWQTVHTVMYEVYNFFTSLLILAVPYF